MVESAIRAERAQERLLERVLGSVRAEPASQEPQNLGSMLLVEPLERRDRHGFHHPPSTLPARRSVRHARMRAAVVGHVEWLEFVPVEAVPRPGEIVHATSPGSRPPGAGRSRRCSSRSSPTPSTSSPRSETTSAEREHATELEAGESRSTRPPSTHPSAAASATSTRRASARSPRSAASCTRAATTRRCPGTSSPAVDAVYFCAGDADALLLARRARVLVATARELATLRQGSRRARCARRRAGRTRPSSTIRASSTRSRGSS